MSDKVSNLFANLSLSHWYKYLLYLAGVLLIVGVAFGSKLPTVQVVPFSFWTMVLMIILWILDDVIYYTRALDEYGRNSVLAFRFVFHTIFFLIWIIIAYRTLF